MRPVGAPIHIDCLGVARQPRDSHCAQICVGMCANAVSARIGSEDCIVFAYSSFTCNFVIFCIVPTRRQIRIFTKFLEQNRVFVRATILANRQIESERVSGINPVFWSIGP